MGVYKPSGLRVLSGPVSPASPLSPLPSQLHFPLLPSARSNSSIPSTPTFGGISDEVEVPPKAMPWIWSCHKCHTRYPLGAIRRCLNDGHLFCGGTTVDKVTGKVKRHRACASEFDYIGWEDFGSWKRRVAQPKPANRSHKNCEHQCDFPSACHWNARHAPKESANFGFLDPKCLGTESNASPTPEKSTLKKTSSVFIDRLVKAAEKRTTQLTTLLSISEEEKNFASMPEYIEASPKLPDLPLANGLELSFPVMDFSSFKEHKEHLDDHHLSPRDVESDPTPSENLPPDLSSSVSSSDDEDVDMTDWLSEDSPSSPLRSPTSAPHSEFISFNFNIDTSHSPQASAEATSPVSPRRNAWDFTAGDIGIALGSPTKPAYGEMWDHLTEMDGLEKEHMRWDKELSILGGQLGV